MQLKNEEEKKSHTRALVSSFRLKISNSSMLSEIIEISTRKIYLPGIAFINWECKEIYSKLIKAIDVQTEIIKKSFQLPLNLCKEKEVNIRPFHVNFVMTCWNRQNFFAYSQNELNKSTKTWIVFSILWDVVSFFVRSSLKLVAIECYLIHQTRSNATKVVQ